eukprot:2374791-Pleurochrysis_carterae.AAC.1
MQERTLPVNVQNGELRHISLQCMDATEYVYAISCWRAAYMVGGASAPTSTSASPRLGPPVRCNNPPRKGRRVHCRAVSTRLSAAMLALKVRRNKRRELLLSHGRAQSCSSHTAGRSAPSGCGRCAR